MKTDSDQLSITAIRRFLDTEVIGRHIYLLGTVDSTNAVARRLAEHGAEEGTVVLAEAQTAGRGRAGVRWFSPEGVNLYASVVLRPLLAVRDLGRFAPIASLALSEAIEAEDLTVEIKWPNDVVADGRKLGGALLDVATVDDRVSYVILGLGVNLNVSRANLGDALGIDAALATSVSELAGRAIDRNRFAARLLNRLEKWHQIVDREGREATLAAWQRRDALRGRPLAVGSGPDAWCGFGCGMDASGCLLVEDAAGRQHGVVSGAVRLLEPAVSAKSDEREVR